MLCYRRCMLMTCDYCGTTFNRPPSQRKKGVCFCSSQCLGLSRRKDRTKNRRLRKQPDHPLAPPSGALPEARAALYDRLGPGPHPCHWCGKTVDWYIGKNGNGAKTLVADHVNDDKLDDRPENVVASCGTCNSSRSRRVRDDETFLVVNGGRQRALERTCEHCDETYLVVPSQAAKGTRFCSRPCARKHEWKRRNERLRQLPPS